MIAEEIVARLRVDAGQFAAGMAAADASLTKFTGGARKMGASMQSAGRSMTTGMTLPIVGLGVLAVKSAADFESAFTGVKKTVDGTPQQFDTLRTSILDMSEAMPASANEIAGVAEAAGQLGIPVTQIEGFTRTMVQMGEATNMTSTEAADSFAHFQNIMGVSTDDMASNSENVGDAVVALGNKFAATESEIMNTSVRMAGAARIAGMAQPDVLALATAMADVGISSELGGTAMSMTFSSMSSAINKGGEDLSAFAKVAGMSGQQFSTQFKQNAPQAVLSFVQGLRQIKQSGGDVFSTLDELGIRGSRQQQTLLSLSGASKKFAQAIGVSNQAFSKGTALGDEYANRLETFDSQLTMFGNSARRAGIDLGTALLPAMQDALVAAQPLIDLIKNVATSFANASPATQGFIVKALALAAALGPITWMAGKVVSAFTILRTGFTALQTGFAAAATGAQRFGSAMTGSQAAMIRNGAAGNAAAAGARTYAATATAASGASVRITTTTTGAAAAMGRYTATAGAAATANTRVAASGGGAAASMTRMTGALSGIGAAAIGVTAVVTALMMLNQASADTAMAVEQMVDRIVAGENLLASGADIQGTQGGLAAFFLDQERTINDVLNRVAKSQFERFTEGTGQINADDAALTNYIQAIGQYASQNLPAARQQYEELVQAFQQRGMDTGMLDPLRDKLTALGVSAQSSAGDVRGLGQSMGGLNRAAANAQWQSQFAAMRQGLAATGGSWMQMKGQVLQTAAAQQQARNAAVQAAGAGTAGANRATAAYQRQVVQLGSLVPKSQQAGGAFRALAQSAGVGANQLRAAVGKYRSGGMSAAQALASALRKGAGPVRNAGRSTGKAGGDGLANGIRAGGSKARGAGGVAGAAAAAGLKGQGGKVQGAGRSTGGKGPDGVVSGIRSSMGKSVQAAIQMMTTVSSAIQGMGPVVYSAGSYVGQQVGQGLVDGMGSMLGAVQDMAAQIASAVDEAVRKKAEISSPSRVMIRNGLQIVAGLVKGLDIGRSAAKKSADKFADALLTTFRNRVAAMKQDAQRIVDYIRQVRATMNSFAAAAGFDASGAQSQAQAYQTAATEAQTAAAAQTAAQAEVNSAQTAATNAARDIAKWDAAGNHYRVAIALDAQKAATEALAAANEKLAAATESNSAAQATLASTARGGIAGGDVVADMRKRVQAAEAFRDNLVKLRNKGLNEDTLREFAEAGPEAAGAAVAALAGGAAAARAANIAQINNLQNRAGSAARTVGDIAGVAKYGPGGTFARNNAIIESGVKVEKGAIVLNFDAEMSRADKREMRRIAQEAMDRALAQLAREIRQKKKTK